MWTVASRAATHPETVAASPTFSIHANRDHSLDLQPTCWGGGDPWLLLGLEMTPCKAQVLCLA